MQMLSIDYRHRSNMQPPIPESRHTLRVGINDFSIDLG